MGRDPTLQEIVNELVILAHQYPLEQRRVQLDDVHRIAWHILISYQSDGAILDVGGGIGLFSLGCAALGMKSYLLDDFADPINLKPGNSILDLHRSVGVEVICLDATSVSLTDLFSRGSLDVVTCFDSIEHWHRSPRRFLHQARAVLKDGGRIVLSLPNAVDLFARIRVLMGISNWSSFEEWYFSSEFRGHVREATITDLMRIAQDLSLMDYRFLGRNWQLTKRGRAFGRVIDRILSTWPCLCSNIYLVGRVVSA